MKTKARIKANGDELLGTIVPEPDTELGPGNSLKLVDLKIFIMKVQHSICRAEREGFDEVGFSPNEKKDGLEVWGRRRKPLSH